MVVTKCLARALTRVLGREATIDTVYITTRPREKKHINNKNNNKKHLNL